MGIFIIRDGHSDARKRSAVLVSKEVLWSWWKEGFAGWVALGEQLEVGMLAHRPCPGL